MRRHPVWAVVNEKLDERRRDEAGPRDGFDSDANLYADAWKAEIESRLREIDEGRVTMVPWEVVRRDLLSTQND